MFKQIIAALKSEDSLDQAFNEFSEMLDHAQWMFVRANEVLRHIRSPEETQETIYQRDKSINALLRSIRRRIVSHLTVSAGTDVAPCLALMSVAKDAERIGDYCKNVFEVGRFYREDYAVKKYHEPLEEVRQQVETLFDTVRVAFRKSDAKAARVALEQVGVIRGRCDKLIEELLRDETSIETHEAVAYSLLARHYKRVAAHLANIATAIFGSIEDLDFNR